MQKQKRQTGLIPIFHLQMPILRVEGLASSTFTLSGSSWICVLLQSVSNHVLWRKKQQPPFQQISAPVQPPGSQKVLLNFTEVNIKQKEVAATDKNEGQSRKKQYRVARS